MSTSNDTTRNCKICKEPYPLTDEYFPPYKNRIGVILLRHYCYACWKINRAEMRKRRDPEKVKAEKRRNVLKHPEAAKRRRDRHTERHPDYSKEKHIKHREADNKRSTEWIKNNRDRFNARMRKRRHTNPIVKMQETVGRHKRRALMKAAEGSYTQQDIQRIFEDQNERCAYCGITLYWSIPYDIHIDHIQPLARGGSNWPDNLACSCADCNLSKGDRTLEEWQPI